MIYGDEAPKMIDTREVPKINKTLKTSYVFNLLGDFPVGQIPCGETLPNSFPRRINIEKSSPLLFNARKTPDCECHQKENN